MTTYSQKLKSDLGIDSETRRGHQFVCDGNHERRQDYWFSVFCSLQMKVGNVILLYFSSGYKIHNDLFVSASAKCYAASWVVSV